jgi:hypothetical protein
MNLNTNDLSRIAVLIGSRIGKITDSSAYVAKSMQIQLNGELQGLMELEEKVNRARFGGGL